MTPHERAYYLFARIFGYVRKKIGRACVPSVHAVSRRNFVHNGLVLLRIIIYIYMRVYMWILFNCDDNADKSFSRYDRYGFFFLYYYYYQHYFCPWNVLHGSYSTRTRIIIYDCENGKATAVDTSRNARTWCRHSRVVPLLYDHVWRTRE